MEIDMKSILAEGTVLVGELELIFDDQTTKFVGVVDGDENIHFFHQIVEEEYLQHIDSFDESYFTVDNFINKLEESEVTNISIFRNDESSFIIGNGIAEYVSPDTKEEIWESVFEEGKLPDFMPDSRLILKYDNTSF